MLGTPRAGWVALAFALMTAPFLLRFVNLVMTEMTALLMLTSAIGAGVAARRGSPAPWLLVAGGCLGLTALTRPAFLYLALAAALVGLAVVLWDERRWQKLPLLLAFLAGIAAVVVPLGRAQRGRFGAAGADLRLRFAHACAARCIRPDELAGIRALLRVRIA